MKDTQKHKKDIKLRITDWWEKDTKENFYNNFIVKMLQDKFNIIYSDTPDFLIYGPFGYEYLKYDCVRIFFTGENVRGDFNLADYSIDFDFLEFVPRHFHCFHAALRGDLEHIATKHEITQSDLESKKEFCAFIVSNSSSPYTDIRDECFHKLNAYKKVHSAGKHNNNVGYQVTDKAAWLKNYKFNICFENSSYPGYLTEKIFDAFAAKCIPIYWGDTSLRAIDYAFMTNENNKDFPQDSINIESKKTNGGGGGNPTQNIESKTNAKSHTNTESKTNTQSTQIDTRLPHIPAHLIFYRLNPKAYINAHNFPTIDALIDEIKRIDSDYDAYIAMLKEPVFLPVSKAKNKDARTKTALNELKAHKQNLKNFLESILAQSPKDAIKRGRAQWLRYKEDDLKKILIFDKEMTKINGLSTLFRYHKFALFINKILIYRLVFRDSIKRLKEFFKSK